MTCGETGKDGTGTHGKRPFPGSEGERRRPRPQCWPKEAQEIIARRLGELDDDTLEALDRQESRLHGGIKGLGQKGAEELLFSLLVQLHGRGKLYEAVIERGETEAVLGDKA